ncbi:MAG: tyrosine-type recombinase/integrase [Halanaerobiales bacterium]|nr:tyrosine-type recombinase/integrase [Halanaerobiales bacterium]
MYELAKFKKDMELKGFSQKTISAYLRYVEEYRNFQSSKDISIFNSDIVRNYLHHLIKVKDVSESYVHCAYSALKFFYQTTLRANWDIVEIPRSKKAKKLPVILSQEEVKLIFDNVQNLKHKAILMTVYSGGLRISEVVQLKIEDIDSKNMQIRVRNSKGKKDRYTLLSKKNLAILRDYWNIYRPRTWLFPGKYKDRPISTRTVHTLRHCFATHLLESGVNIYYIQELMGHSNVSTTSIYIHLTRKDLLNIVSPLDLMAGDIDD